MEREKRLKIILEKCPQNHQCYNIPIDVDTIEKGYPILCA